MSLLFHEKCQHWTDKTTVMSGANLPNIAELAKTIAAFKESLCTSEDKVRQIERDTQQQRHSSLWYSVRRYRITASLFGTVLSHRDSTRPDNLVLRIIQPKQFSTPSTQHGVCMEHVAVRKYAEYQHLHGHPNLTVCSSGFIVCTPHSFLGASPDGAVYDPSHTPQPFGFWK